MAPNRDGSGYDCKEEAGEGGNLLFVKIPYCIVIAHDAVPIELVEIPYCIVKGKAQLGVIIHNKTATVLCLTTIKNEDKLEFSKILEAIKANFNDKFDEIRKWGDGVIGSKSQAKTKAKEAAQRMS